MNEPGVLSKYLQFRVTPCSGEQPEYLPFPATLHRDFFTFFKSTIIIGLLIASKLLLLRISGRFFVLNKQLHILICLLLCILAFSVAPLFAANAPITIEADRMTSLEANNNVLFRGNVDATQADVRIRSDEMTVYYTAAEEGRKQEVKRLKCVGNVEVTKGEWLGTGQTMNYLAKERKVILSGDAKAWQDTNLVSGNTIIYYLDEGRSEVVGSRTSATVGGDTEKTNKSGRVRATLTPQ